jgi:cob(I)alamin adenosyltransferase
MAKIYTRTGDDGTTGLGGGRRVAKDSLRVEAYGTVDELNSHLGVARAADLDSALDEALSRIQSDLFHLGSDLAFPAANREAAAVAPVGENHVEWLEGLIDRLAAELPPLENFILQGGSPGAAQLHLARTVCRRAERLVVALAREEKVGSPMIRFLNRLSDALFVMARYENWKKRVSDVLWEPRI